MTQNIIDAIEELIKRDGIEKAKISLTNMLNMSLENKKDRESKNFPLGNIPSHIQMGYDALAYITNRQRMDKLKILFESNVLTFNEFTFRELILTN
jgi:hypothetical protein